MTRQIAVVTTLAASVAAYLGWAVWSGHRWPTIGFDHGYQLIDLKAVGDFSLDTRSLTATIPAVDAALDGKRVGFDGFIYDPANAFNQTPAFLLVYKVGEHGPPRVQERIYCRVLGGRGVDNPGMYTLVRVFGTLHVGVHHDTAGEVDSVYRMDVDRVDPVPSE